MGKIDDYEKLTQLLKTRWVNWLSARKLWISFKDYLDMRKNYCSACGGIKNEPQMYWGEEFCGECVKVMDPNGAWSKSISRKKGFKMDIK